MTAATNLPDQLAAELAALPPFTGYVHAVNVINGLDGGSGVRVRYLNQLYALASAAKLSDPFVMGIGAAINLACDRAIALCAPIQCAETRWTSVPVDCLTQTEKDNLR